MTDPHTTSARYRRANATNPAGKAYLGRLRSREGQGTVQAAIGRNWAGCENSDQPNCGWFAVTPT
jgi:hypothetical protein